MKWKTVFVDRTRRFALDVDMASGRCFVSIPVRNQSVEYDEYYEVDPHTFSQYVTDPVRAYDFVDRAKRRELDHLLLFEPGTDRGAPD